MWTKLKYEWHNNTSCSGQFIWDEVKCCSDIVPTMSTYLNYSTRVFELLLGNLYFIIIINITSEGLSGAKIVFYYSLSEGGGWYKMKVSFFGIQSVDFQAIITKFWSPYYLVIW